MYNKICEMAELAYRSGGDPEALLLHPTKASELVESMGITEGLSTFYQMQTPAEYEKNQNACLKKCSGILSN
jgi:hypothetical protein